MIGKLIIDKTQFVTKSKDEIDKHWKDQVCVAEKLLIYNCAPAFNSANIVDHGLGDKEVIVFNYGKRGQLPLEVSTLYDNSIYWYEMNGGNGVKKWKYFDELYNESNK